MQGIVKEDIRTSTKCVEVRSNENAISAINDAIAEKIGQQKFRIWFKNSTRLTLSDGLLKVGVINPFIANWLESHFSAHVTESARAVVGASCQVSFIVDPQLCDSHRAAAFEWQAKPALNSPVTAESGRTITQRPTYYGQKLKLTFDSFVVGHSNELAYNAAKAVINDKQSPFNPLFIHGGYGLGKTHLLQGICTELRRTKPAVNWLYMSAEDFANQFVLALKTRKLDAFRSRIRQTDLLAIDDIHFLASKPATQEEFLHTFNTLDLAGRQVILASDSHPKMITQISEKLISRFVSGMVVKIDQPDFKTRCEICRRYAQGMKKPISEDVIAYVAEHLRSNIRELQGAILKIAAFASLQNAKIGLAMAQEI